MWPFKNKKFNKDGSEKYRKWLKRWLLGGWIIYAAIAVMMLAVVLVPSVRAQVAEWIGERLTKETSAVYSQQPLQELTPEAPAPQVAKAEESEETPEAAPKETPPAEKPEEPKPPEEFTFTELARLVNGVVITGYGGMYSEIYKDYRFHDGLDFGAKPGTEVKAALKGTVAEITGSPDLGLTVTVEHGSGWKTSYSNLGQVQLKQGRPVEVGTVIGLIGKNTGDVKEAHVHFTLTHNNESVNPTPYFDFN